MNQKTKYLMSTLLKAFVAGLLVSGHYGVAFAAAGTSIGASATVVDREVVVSKGLKMTLEDKGVKQVEFFASASAGLVVDEDGDAPTCGDLVSVEVSTGPSAGTCYFMVFDSSSTTIGVGALDNSKAGYALIPPVVAQASYTVVHEFRYPKQFYRGLVGKLSSATDCRATLGWRRCGGKN